MRWLLLATLILAPALLAQRGCFGEPDKYRWFEVKSVAEVEALPEGVEAVAAPTAGFQPEIVEALADIESLQAIHVDGTPEIIEELQRLPNLRLLRSFVTAENIEALTQLSGLEVLLFYETGQGAKPEVLEKLGALEKLHTLVLGGSMATNEWSMTPAQVRALAKLPALRQLDLSWVQFESAALAELSKLDGLVELELYANYSPDDHVAAALSGLSSLRRLFLSFQHPRQPEGIAEAIGSMETLEILDLTDGPLAIDEAFATEIAGLPSLVELNLSGIILPPGGFATLCDCSSLKRATFQASEMEMKHFTQIERLKALESLELRLGLASDGALRSCAKLPNLISLTVSGGSATGEGLEGFPANLRKLSLLDMDRFQAASLKHVAALESLTIVECTELEGELQVLSSLNKLVELDVKGKAAPLRAELESLTKLPRLKRLRIETYGEQYVEGTGIVLGQCVGLESLELAGWGQFPSDELPQLRKLEKLKRLRVIVDRISNEVLFTISEMDSLRELALGALEEDEDVKWDQLTDLQSLRELAIESYDTFPAGKLRLLFKGRDVRVRDTFFD